MPPQKFKVGLIQMSATSDPDKNLQHAIDKIHQASARGAQIVCLPELFQTQYFCQREDSNLFDLAQPIPGPVTTVWQRWPNSFALFSSPRYLRSALPASITTPRSFSTLTAPCSGSIARCTSPTIRCTTKSITSLRATSATAPSTPPSAGSGTLVCWDQWYPEGARLTALQGAQVLFYPTAIGWHPRRKPSSDDLNTTPGAPFSAPTPSPTACTWRSSIVLDTKPEMSAATPFPAMAWNSGEALFSATHSGASSPKLRTTRKKF